MAPLESSVCNILCFLASMFFGEKNGLLETEISYKSLSKEIHIKKQAVEKDPESYPEEKIVDPLQMKRPDFKKHRYFLWKGPEWTLSLSGGKYVLSLDTPRRRSSLNWKFQVRGI